MKANELRINNYYKSVKFNCPVQCTISDMSQLYYDCDGAVLDEDIIFRMFEPIPLDEKYINGFGFSESMGYWIKEGSDKSPYFQVALQEMEGEKLRLTTQSDDVLSEPINYVHQLQNLYFALTGKEL